MVFPRRNRLTRYLRWGQVALVLAAMMALSPVGPAQEPTRKVIARTAPTYPELARKMQLSGKVKLGVVITANGAVKSAKMLGGSPVFEKSALEAVKQWRFEPAEKETKAVIVLEFDNR